MLDEVQARCEQLLESSDHKALDAFLSRVTSQDVGCSRDVLYSPLGDLLLESISLGTGKAGAVAALTNSESSSSGSSLPSAGVRAEGSPEGSPLLDDALKQRRLVLDDDEVPRCSLGCVAGSASGSAASRKGRKAAGCRFLDREAGASDGSDDHSSEEDASDADSDGNLKNFTVKDYEASESDYETDEEIEQPPVRCRLHRNHAVDDAKLDSFVHWACRLAHGRPRVLRELAYRLEVEAATLEKLESAAGMELVRDDTEGAEESGDEGQDETGFPHSAGMPESRLAQIPMQTRALLSARGPV